MKFVHLHTSSRYNVHSDILEQYLDKYMAQSHLITITEVYGGKRTNKLREKGWDFHVPNKNYRDDSTIAWDRSKFELMYEESYQTSKDKGAQSGVPYCGFVVLETVNGSVIVVGSGHLPHGIENEVAMRKVFSKNGRAYMSEMRGMRKRANQLKRRFKADAVILAADWNVNIKRVDSRALYKLFFPAYKVALTKGLKGATHAGGRIIDFTLYKGAIRLVKRPVVMPQDKSSDHSPYKETFEV